MFHRAVLTAAALTLIGGAASAQTDVPFALDWKFEGPAAPYFVALDEGYFADIVLVDENDSWTVAPENILYKCGWSPFEGHTFKGKVNTTIVSGHLAYHEGQFDESQWGQRLLFDR